jgi:ribosomal-protein-alanine N-acetyltransferase
LIRPARGDDLAALVRLEAAARGRGVARLLLSSAEATAAQANCRAMRLEVRASNSHAIRLYDQAGYRVLQRVENYYPDGEAAIRMEKTLVPHLQGL